MLVDMSPEAIGRRLRTVGELLRVCLELNKACPTATSPHQADTATIPWRELFPEYLDEDVPGVCLRSVRRREGMTQADLALRLGIPRRHISEMERGKRPIGEEMAKRLGAALNIGYKVFL